MTDEEQLKAYIDERYALIARKDVLDFEIELIEQKLNLEETKDFDPKAIDAVLESDDETQPSKAITKSSNLHNTQRSKPWLDN